MSHAPIAPSALALTIACNASVQMQASVPPLPDTDESAEGTAAHWVALRYAAGHGHELPTGASFHSGGRAWTVDEDMHAAAVMYTRAVGGPHDSLMLEQQLRIPRVHDTQCYGTPDAAAYFADARQAHAECPEGLPADRFAAGKIKLVRVVDFKFGHRFVEVFENAQLTAYVAGVMHAHGIVDDLDPDLFFEMILVQPRTYTREGPVRVWRGQMSRLRAVLNAAATAAQAALTALPDARTGAHCIDCKARHVCGALLTNTASIVEYSHAAERVDLSAQALGQELAIVDDALKHLKARQTGLAAMAESMIRDGVAVLNYSLQPGRSSLTYLENVSTTELVSFGDMIGVNLRRTLTLKDQVVTPTQAIALGIDAEVMKSYAHRPAGKLSLTRDNIVQSRKVFNR